MIWAANPSLVIDSNDNPMVAYMEQTVADRNWMIVVSRWTGANWVGGGAAVSAPARESREPSLALDSSGQPVVAWAHTADTNFEIHLKRFDGTFWNEIDGSATGGGVSNTNADSRYPSLDISRDRACVAWTDAGPTGLQTAVRCIDL